MIKRAVPRLISYSWHEILRCVRSDVTHVRTRRESTAQDGSRTGPEITYVSVCEVFTPDLTLELFWWILHMGHFFSEEYVAESARLRDFPQSFLLKLAVHLCWIILEWMLPCPFSIGDLSELLSTLNTKNLLHKRPERGVVPSYATVHHIKHDCNIWTLLYSIYTFPNYKHIKSSKCKSSFDELTIILGEQTLTVSVHETLLTIFSYSYCHWLQQHLKNISIKLKKISITRTCTFTQTQTLKNIHSFNCDKNCSHKVV